MTGTTWEVAEGVTVHHMPGHRRGQLVVSALTAEGVLVCSSDAAKNARELLNGVAAVYDVDMSELSRASVDAIIAMADVVIPPGHDRPLRIVDAGQCGMRISVSRSASIDTERLCGGGGGSHV